MEMHWSHAKRERERECEVRYLLLPALEELVAEALEVPDPLEQLQVAARVQRLGVLGHLHQSTIEGNEK